MINMRDKTIRFLISEKENLNEEIEDLIYPDMYYNKTYKPLSVSDIQKIENCRKEILNIYALIDILGGVDNND